MREMTTGSDSGDLVVLVLVSVAIGLFAVGVVALLILWFWDFIGRIFPDPPEG